MVATLKKAARRARDSQPLNFLATSAVKALGGARSEFVIKHLPRGGRVESRLPNGRRLRLASRGDDWVSNQVYWRGWDGYEPDTSPLFYRLAERASVTLDVGAHVGYYALVAAHANPSGRVFAFEPMPASYERLRRNVELNGLSNVVCVNSAVGERDGEAEIYFPPSEVPVGATLSKELNRLLPGMESAPVRVVSLDGFARERGLESVELVKIDTETTEMEVLRGMREIMGRFRPAIFCEFWEGPARALAEVFTPLGYRCYRLTGGGPVPYDGGKSEWNNYLFTTSEVEDFKAPAA